MSEVPEVRYARNGDGAHIAYMQFGYGDLDLVLLPGWFSHVELLWDEPSVERFLRRLGSFARVLILDRRGVGLSDPMPVSELSLEGQAEDVLAVMDDAGVERAAFFGSINGGTLALHLAGTQPDRVISLLVFNSCARISRTDGYDIGVPADVYQRAADDIAANWGRGWVGFSPNESSPHMVRWRNRYQRNALPPGPAAARFLALGDLDARETLAGITAPTLIVHNRDNRVIRVTHARYLAERIPGSRLVELDSDEPNWFLTDSDPLFDEITEFFTGTRDLAEDDHPLAVLLFTDLVDSTKRAASIGDHRWRAELDAHDALVRRQLDRFGGRAINTTGDGFLAELRAPTKAIECAHGILAGAADIGLVVRAGVHLGEVQRRGNDVTGLSVVIAARTMSLAAAGEVLVSDSVRMALAGSPLRLEDRGEHKLKGVPGSWRLWSAT